MQALPTMETREEGVSGLGPAQTMRSELIERL
jgi:hypothetical protein